MIDWESTEQDYDNFENWCVTRYVETRNRYMVTARHELGYQLKEYCNRGVWQGASEHDNRLFEELQYFYRNELGIAVKRTLLLPNVRLFEITQDRNPKCAVISINGKIKVADKKDIKDGYRYTFK
jgi:hypothetical protein